MSYEVGNLEGGSIISKKNWKNHQTKNKKVTKKVHLSSKDSASSYESFSAALSVSNFTAHKAGCWVIWLTIRDCSAVIFGWCIHLQVTAAKVWFEIRLLALGIGRAVRMLCGELDLLDILKPMMKWCRLNVLIQFSGVLFFSKCSWFCCPKFLRS